MCFPVNFVKFLRTPFFIEHLWWLLLVVGILHFNQKKLQEMVIYQKNFLDNTKLKIVWEKQTFL